MDFPPKDAVDGGPKRLNVLLVEDNPAEAALIRAMLDRPGIRLHLAVSLREARSILQAEQTDVVVLDLTPPDARALAPLAALTADFPRIPLVVLAGAEDEELGLSLVRQGADDYLPKSDASLKLLHRAVYYAYHRKRRAS